MKSIKKRALCIFVILTLVLSSLVFAFADEPEPLISVSNVRALQDRTVTINIDISNNPGIAAMKLYISYDDEVLSLVNVEDTGKLGKCHHGTDIQSMSKQPYTLVWMDDTADKDYSSNGTIAKLSFRVSEEAEFKAYPITVSYETNDVINSSLNSVPFDTRNGNITVIDAKPGDIDGDGKVSMLDCIKVMRKIAKWTDFLDIDDVLADMNADGKVSLADGVILLRHIANWDGYEVLPYRENEEESSAALMYSVEDTTDGIKLEIFDDYSVLISVPEGEFTLGEKSTVCVSEYNDSGYCSGTIKTYNTNHKGTKINITELLGESDLPSSITAKCRKTSITYSVKYDNGKYSCKLTDGNLLAFAYRLYKSDVCTIGGNTSQKTVINPNYTWIKILNKQYKLTKQYTLNGRIPSSIENDFASRSKTVKIEPIQDIQCSIAKGTTLCFNGHYLKFTNSATAKIEGADVNELADIEKKSISDGAKAFINAVKGKDIVITIE